MHASEIFGISIESVREGGDGVDFNLVVQSNGQNLTYQGTASRSALAQIDGTTDAMAAFDANRARILAAVAKDWRSQPSTAKYVIDSSNVHTFGFFVNNG